MDNQSTNGPSFKQTEPGLKIVTDQLQLLSQQSTGKNDKAVAERLLSQMHTFQNDIEGVFRNWEETVGKARKEGVS